MRKLLSRLSGSVSEVPSGKLEPRTQPAVASQPMPMESSLELPPELITLAFSHPGEAHRALNETVKHRWGLAAELGKGVRLHYSPQLLTIPHSVIWSAPPGPTIRDTTEELIVALENLTHEEIFNRHYGPVERGAYNMPAYLRCTRIRLLHLFESLCRMDMRNGTVLEVGSLYGSFSLILQRLGFQVTAVDRYESYGAGFTGAVALMRDAGVHVVSTTREAEEDVIASLPQFDCVISMAVVEHIPHTPRLFLEQLFRRVKPGGILALDTPNLVRYWNRVNLAAGKSIFMDIKSQYHADLPYEGHHREYTGPELRWMLEQVGCKDVKVTHFDYNLFQFESIDRPHIDCLLRILEDPTYADTILALGRI